MDVGMISETVQVLKGMPLNASCRETSGGSGPN